MTFGPFGTANVGYRRPPMPSGLSLKHFARVHDEPALQEGASVAARPSESFVNETLGRMAMSKRAARAGAQWREMAHHLTPRQERAIVALLVERDQSAAATAVGIGRRTLTRWLGTPDFREAYRLASQQRLADTVGLLRAVAGDALAALRAALQSGNEHVRVRAAVAVLDLAVKVDTDELAARVEVLEEHARAMEDATKTAHPGT